MINLFFLCEIKKFVYETVVSEHIFQVLALDKKHVQNDLQLSWPL